MTLSRSPRRSPTYLSEVRRQRCALCGAGPCEAHHVKVRGTVALGRKVSDYQTVPLCVACHRAVHDHPVSESARALMAERALEYLVAWVEGRRR